MKLKGFFRNLMIVFILVLNFSCDQITKTIVRKTVAEYEIIPLIDGYLTLTKVENTGAFLSAGSSLPYFIRFLVLTLLPIVFLSYGLYLIIRKKELPQILIIAWCFVIGGGIGNLYDRIVHGSVTDFLHLDLGLFQTGIFNMADVSIMTGMFIIIWRQFLIGINQNSKGD
ncbi:signal peptidase II [Daejeonella rubra]|uniref:Lipoprotein signal peptidase n=1 Tax=Daejeonella rubra TaxID=990371 RepID=A0A1G9ML62_9SPHI|nr:signal peptidase II [Daejeonella rubra]SDL74998.1 signal peptidase II [Daejeonella rubra]